MPKSEPGANRSGSPSEEKNMDRSRTPLLIAAVVSLAAASFAVVSGLTSTEDDEPAAVAAESAPAAATTQFDIEIADFEFGPGEAVVAVGTEVVWTNNDGFEHSVVANDDAFAASPTLGEGDTYSVTFTEPGTYTYICGIHRQMIGTIVVEG